MNPQRVIPSNHITEVVTVDSTQKKQIEQLRAEGVGYGAIAGQLGISVNTIKAYCKRNGLGGIKVVVGESIKEKARKEIIAEMPIQAKPEQACRCCGEPLVQLMGRKEKRFCSDRCRNKWWNAHLDKVKRRANYDFVCAYCKKAFISYGNKNRKYCSHSCYIEDRFGRN